MLFHYAAKKWKFLKLFSFSLFLKKCLSFSFKIGTFQIHCEFPCLFMTFEVLASWGIVKYVKPNLSKKLHRFNVKSFFDIVDKDICLNQFFKSRQTAVSSNFRFLTDT